MTMVCFIMTKQTDRNSLILSVYVYTVSLDFNNDIYSLFVLQ